MDKYIDKEKAIAMDEYVKKESVLSILRWRGTAMGAMDTAKGLIMAVQDMPAEDVIPLGVEMWADRFNIQTRTWRTKDGETEAKSFIITRREREGR